MNKEELIYKLGRKWQGNVKELAVLAKYFMRPVESMSVPLNTCSTMMVKLFGYPVKVSRVIRRAVKVGMLRIDPNKSNFSFNHEDVDNNYSRSYYFDHDVARTVLDIANVLYMQEIGVGEGPAQHYNVKNDTDRSERSVAINVHPELLDISFGVTYDMDDLNPMTTSLAERYPQISFYSSYLDLINLQYSTMAGYFYTFLEPTAHVSSNTVRFGIRAHSFLCSMPKIPCGTTCRLDILDDWFGKGRWVEYDLNASIYRIARSCRQGIWYDSEEDVYEKLHEGPFADEGERKKFKKTCNIINFAKDANTACSAYRQTFTESRNMRNGELRPQLEPLKGRISKFSGDFSSEVFLHESCIMIGAAYRLLKKGYRVVLLYDCMFIEKEAYEHAGEAIKDSFEDYYTKFIKGK